MCKVSFVTSVYNCEEYIAETIESVLKQTFTDWEYILIDDCSKDKSAEIISSFNDSRIKFIQNKTNQGQSYNLNYGISLAQGEYIARLDHDDICYPDRIEKQIKYMEDHPDIVLCGSWMDIWQDGEIYHRQCPAIIGPREHGFSLAFDVFCIAHSSYFIRKNVMIENNIKYREYKYAEDYDLLLQLIHYGGIDYIRESLIAYRFFSNQFTATCGKKLINEENYEIRSNYYSTINLPYKEIFEKAIRKELISKKDYENFEQAFLAFASSSGIQDATNNECVKYVYGTVCQWQKYSLRLYFAYVKLVDKKWILTNEGIRFLAKCILRYKRKEWLE